MANVVNPYSLPTWGFLRWVTDPVVEVPEDLRADLVSGFFTSWSPIVFGAVANTAVNAVATILHPSVPFYLLLGADVLIVLSRLVALWTSHRAARLSRPTPTNVYLLCGLSWAGVVGTGTAMCVASADPVLQFLAPTTMMGITSGMATRNSGAPRFAIAQIMLCDIPLQFVLPFLGHPWMLLSILQCPIFLLGMIATVRRLNRAYTTVVMAERESVKRAMHDGLTGTLNRDGLMKALSVALQQAAPCDVPLALLYMDLDGFKSVNDTYGHAAGDELLRQVADRLVMTLPGTWCLGRLGGDEFVAAAPRTDAVSAAAIGQSVVAAIERPFDLRSGIDVRIGISIGIACATPVSTVDNLLSAADVALYRAKVGGKGRCSLDSTTVTAREAA